MSYELTEAQERVVAMTRHEHCFSSLADVTEKVALAIAEPLAERIKVLEAQLERCAEAKLAIYKADGERFRNAITTACDWLQCGGKLAHLKLVPLGADILQDGIPAMGKKIMGLERERDSYREERDRWKELARQENSNRDYWKDRADKAEAELADLRAKSKPSGGLVPFVELESGEWFDWTQNTGFVNPYRYMKTQESGFDDSGYHGINAVCSNGNPTLFSGEERVFRVPAPTFGRAK